MKPNQRARAYTLLQRNTPQREIARLTGIDRKTIRSYKRRRQAEQLNFPGVATEEEEHVYSSFGGNAIASAIAVADC